MQSPRAQTAPSDAYNMQKSDSQLERWHKRLAAKRAAEAAVRGRRRCVRTLALLLYLGAAYGAWCLAALPFTHIEDVRPYDPALGLTLQASSCDVELRGGAEATVAYRALWRAYERRWGMVRDDGTVGDAYFGNNAGACADAATRSCRATCLVTVTVPDAAADATFQIDQPSDDGATAPVVTVAGGTTVGTLSVGAWWKKAPTLSIRIEAEASVGTLSARLLAGDVSAVNATIGDVAVQADEGGSIYLLDLHETSTDVTVNWRQPSNRLCLTTDLGYNDGAFLSSGADPLAMCDIRGDPPASTYHYLLTSLLYDPNKNGKVTMDEFKGGLGELMCCGGNCPFSSNGCTAEAYEFGFADAAFGLTIGTVTSTIAARGDAMLVQDCMVATTVGCAGAAAAHKFTETKTYSKLNSRKGEVVVSLRQRPDDWVGYPPAWEWGQPRNVTADVATKLSGFRILDTDAKRLMEKYGASHGDRSSTEDVYLTIDAVVGSQGAHAHAPTARFVYVTNPAYLVIDPAHLTMLAAGSLTPPLARETVHFVDNDCSLDHGLADPMVRNATLARMHDHITRSLRSSAHERAPLRGVLVLMNEAGCGVLGVTLGCTEPSFLSFPPAAAADDDGVAPAAVAHVSPVRTHLYVSVALSSALGLLLGLALLIVVTRYLAMISRWQWQADVAKRTVLLSRMGLSHAELTATKAEENAADDEDNSPTPPGPIPYLRPFSLLETIIVRPLRARLVNSVSSFVRQRMCLHPLSASVEANGGPKAPFVYMREFCRQYEFYCLEQGLSMESSRDEIQRTLIDKHNVRCRQLVVRRIRHLAWRPDAPPLSARGGGGEIPRAKTPPPPAAPDAPGLNEVDAATLREFIEERCMVDQASFIDMEDRAGPDGGTRRGFRPQLRAWCRLRGKSAPPLRGTAWASALPKTARFFDQQRVRKVIGLSSSKGGEGVTVSNTWYALEFLTVAVHFVFCFAPPALLIGYALTVQHIYGLHLSPIAPDAPALTLLAAVQPYPTAPPSATSSLIAFRVALWGSIGMMGMSVFRLLFSYLDLQGSKKKNAAPGCSSVVGYAVRGAYAVALMVSMSVVFAWAGVVAAWFVLAAAIEPTRFLPFGIAVITVGVVGVTMASTMVAAAERLKEKLAAAFDLMLKHRLKRAMKKIEREVRAHTLNNPAAIPDLTPPIPVQVYLKSLEQGEMLASQWEDADVEAGGAAAAAAAQEEAKEKEVTR